MRPARYFSIIQLSNARGQRPAGFCRMWAYFLKIFSKTYFRPPLADADSIGLRKGIAPGQAIYRVARTVDSMTQPEL